MTLTLSRCVADLRLPKMSSYPFILCYPFVYAFQPGQLFSLSAFCYLVSIVLFLGVTKNNQKMSAKYSHRFLSRVTRSPKSPLVFLFLFPLICDARTRPAYTEWRRLHQYYKFVDPLCKPTNLFWFVFFFSFFLFVSCAIRPLFCYLYQFITTCTLGMGRKRDEGIGNNERVWRWTMMRRLSSYFLDLHGARTQKLSDDDDNGRRQGVVVVVTLFR